MIGIDPKGFCQIPGVTAGVGWWWGEVGGVVAGNEGAVANNGVSNHIHANPATPAYIVVDDDNAPYPKRFLLLGMLLFKDILAILAVEHPDSTRPA